MIKRFFAIAILATSFLATITNGAQAQGLPNLEVKDLWVFGDSLSDTGNLSALSGGTVPGPLYFDGRFSDGPVWVETFADRLNLDFDISAPFPFSSNFAIAGAFTGPNGLADQPSLTTGVLSQIGIFFGLGGSFDSDDLVVVWAGANDYFFTATDPGDAVDNLVLAVTLLAGRGAEHFLVPNLPDLGTTPLAVLEGRVSELRDKTNEHNSELSQDMSALADQLDVEIVVVDIGTAFADVLKKQRIYGLTNVSESCVIQLLDGSRIPSGACPDEGSYLNSTGFLFWDLIHPTGSVHELISVFAKATYIVRNRLPDRIFDPERVATRIALAKLRVFGALTNLGGFARRGDDFNLDASHQRFRFRHRYD